MKKAKKRIGKLMDRLIAKPGKKISLKDYDPGWTGNIKDKSEAANLLEDGVKELAKQQDKLYAQDTYSLLMVFQAMSTRKGARCSASSRLRPRSATTTTCGGR